MADVKPKVFVPEIVPEIADGVRSFVMSNNMVELILVLSDVRVSEISKRPLTGSGY